MVSASTVDSPNEILNELFNVTLNATEPTTIVYDYPPYLKITSITLCVLILVFGVVGNIMVPVVILRTKDMRNSTNIFLMNLSLADLLVLLICTPTVLVELNSKPETWVLGEFLCKIIPFVELTVAHASVLTILAITFERYYAICEPLRAGYVCTKARALVICIITWFVAAFCTSPIAMISEYRIMEYVDGTFVPVCLTNADTFWSIFYFLVINSMFYLGPFVLLIFMYSVIARHLMADPGTNCSERAYNVRARKQVVAMLVTVVVAFFLCLLPFRLFTLWIILAPVELLESHKKDNYYLTLYSCRILLYVNSAINPMLYNLMSSKFRQGFKNVLSSAVYRKRRRSQFRPRARNDTRSSSSITRSSTKMSVLARTGSSLLLRKGRCDSQERRHQKNGFPGGGAGDDDIAEEDDVNVSGGGVNAQEIGDGRAKKNLILKLIDQPESFV